MTLVMSNRARAQCAWSGCRAMHSLAMALDRTGEADVIGAVRHASAEVHCQQHGCSAVVSVVQRDDCRTPVRFVLWCSLRGCADCSEGCLRTVASVPISP